MDTLIPISDACSRYNVPELELKRLVASGKMKLMIYGGVTLVSEEDLQQNLPRDERPEYKQFANLSGIEISVREASRKYNIPNPTISRWIKNGYITIIRHDGRKTLVDESDVAYCAWVYKNQGGSQGKWLFRQNGTPYTPKGRK